MNEVAPDGSTATIFVFGDNFLKTVKNPEIRPPPPTGINM